MSASVLQAALGEFDVLLGRKLELDTASTGVTAAGGGADKSAHGKQLTQTTITFADDPRTAEFNSEEVKLRLKQLQRWLQLVVSPQHAAELWSKLLAQEKIFESNSSKIANAKGRHTKDKQETVDEMSDDQSATFFLLETLYKVCGSLLQEDGLEDLFNPNPKPLTSITKEAKAIDYTVLQSVPESLITFCFSRLHLAFSGGIRRLAGLCLGLLSKHFLPIIAPLFLNSLIAIKKDSDAREYVTYQKALPLLDFGFRDGGQVVHTIGYLAGLAVQMKKIDRGVLRMEICESLRQIFAKILTSKGGNKQAAQWDYFQASESKEFEQFHDTMEKIYLIGKTWSKKDKHALFCYDMMSVMVCTVKIPRFYNRYSGDLFNLVLSGLKKEKLRAKCLEICAYYVRESPEIFVANDKNNVFLGRVRTLLAHILPKGKNPEEHDIPALILIVKEICDRFLAFTVGEYALEVLTTKKGNYRTTTKAIVLTALGQIAHAQSTRVEKYGVALAPIILFFITEHATKKPEEKKKKDDGVDKRAMILSAALSCFPYIGDPEGDVNKLLTTIPTISTLTLDADRAVSSAAVTTLTDLMKLDPKNLFIPIVYSFITLFNNIELTNVQMLLKASNNLSLILATTIDLLESPAYRSKFIDAVRSSELASRKAALLEGVPPTTPPLPVFVDPRQWINMRLHLEAACVRWLCHHEVWVRGEIFRLMQQFSDPVLRALEASEVVVVADSNGVEGKKNNIHMIDILCPVDSPPESVAPGGFCESLRNLLLNNYNDFKTPLNFAFSLVCDLPPTVLTMDDSVIAEHVRPDNEWWSIYKNILVFCGLAFHPTSLLTDEQVSNFGLAKPKDNKKEDVKLDDTTAGLLSIRATRAGMAVPVTRALIVPSLYEFQVSESDCLEYLDFVFKALHTSHPRLQVVGHLVRKSLYQVPTVAYSAVVTCLRREYDHAQANKKKPLPHADFLHHEHTLELFAQLILRTSADEYYSGPIRIVETLELLVSMMLSEYNTHEFAKLSPRLKVQLVSLIGQYVVYRLKPVSSGSPHESKLEVLSNRPNYFQFLTSKNVFPQGSRMRDNTIPIDEQEEKLLSQLEQAVAKCILALISLGTFNHPFLENQILRFLHRMPINRDEQVQAEVQRAMTAFLQFNPKRLDEFVCNTSKFTQEDSLMENGFPVPTISGENLDAEQHELETYSGEFGSPPPDGIQEMRAIVQNARNRPTRQMSLVLGPEETIVHRTVLANPIAVRITVFYITAVCESWISRLGTKHDWIGTQGISPATMLAFCLLHRNAPDIRARNQALRLAKALADKLSPPLNPGFNIDELSHSSPFVYIQSTLQYSRGLASQPANGHLISPLLKECERLNQILGDADRHNLFKMLVPWIQQIGYYVTMTLSSTTTAPASSSVVVEDNDNDDEEDEGKHNNDNSVSKNNGKSLVDPFRDVFKSLIRVTMQSHRSSATAHIVNDMWEAVTHTTYTQVFIPEIVKFFIDFYTNLETQHEITMRMEEIEADELRALLKLAFVAMCRGKSFNAVLECMLDSLKHYSEPPSLMPSAFVSWMDTHPSANDSVTPQEQSCFDLLASAMYENASILQAAFPRLLMNACVLFENSPNTFSFLRFAATTLNFTSLATNTNISTDGFLNAVINHAPLLRADWAKEALVWGCMSGQPDIAIESLQIYRKLVADPGFSPLPQVIWLSLAIHSSVKQSQPQQKLVALVDALLSTSPPTEREGWQVLMSVGWGLLQITKLDTYKSGLALLHHALLRQPSSLTWLGQGALPFSGAEFPDKTIASTLLPGLMSVDTQRFTTHILSILALHSSPGPQVLCLSLVSSLLFALTDLLFLMHMRYTVPDSKQLSTEETELLLEDIESCMRLNRQLSEQKGESAESLSRVFYRLASLLFRGLSSNDIQSDINDAGSKDLTRERVKSLRSALDSLERVSEGFEVPVVPPPSHQRVSFDILISGRNQINSILRFFIFNFMALFKGREIFDSVISWLCTLLSFWLGGSEHRMVMLLCLGHVLQIGTHNLSSSQTCQITEQLEKEYQHPKESFRHLVENVAKVLCNVSSTPPPFSFLRARTSPEKSHAKSTTNTQGASNNAQLTPIDASQHTQCLSFIETKAFAALERVLQIEHKNEPSPTSTVKENENHAETSRIETTKRAADEKAAIAKAEREKQQKEAIEKEQRERVKDAREKEARDKEARDKEARDKEAREKEAREKAAREKEARDKEAREKLIIENQRKDEEEREREAREIETRKKEDDKREKEVAEQKRMKDLLEKEQQEAQDKASKEANPPNQELKGKADKEIKEISGKEAKEKEELAKKESTAKQNKPASVAASLNFLLKAGPPTVKQPPPPPTTSQPGETTASNLASTRRVAHSTIRKAPTLKPFVALAESAPSVSDEIQTVQTGEKLRDAVYLQKVGNGSDGVEKLSATSVTSAASMAKRTWQARLEDPQEAPEKVTSKVSVVTSLPIAVQKTPPPPKVTTVVNSLTSIPPKSTIVEDDLDRQSREAAEKLEQARNKLMTLKARNLQLAKEREAERIEKEKAHAADDELAG